MSTSIQATGYASRSRRAGGVSPLLGKNRGLTPPARQGRAYFGRHTLQATLDLALPAGKYRAEWINTKTGAVDKKEEFEHGGGFKKLASPPYQEDIALRVRG
jgi:hypothetical protein